jgi:natural resistance-associated macrophage protein
MAVCFCINMLYVQPEISDILGGFVPQVTNEDFDQMIGLVGAVIMPHNLFLHSALVLTREIDRTDRKNIKEANFYFSLEAMISLSVSFLINMCVICTFAYWHLRDTGHDITLQTAHSALQDTFGENAKLVWAIGLLAAGQSSTMTGTYAGQFVMQGFMRLRFPAWVQVMITRSIAIFPALIVAFSESIDSLDGWINILQAIQLPFALIPLLKFTSSSEIMQEFKSHKFVTGFCTVVSIVIICVNMGTVIPTMLYSDEEGNFQWTRGKLLLIFFGVVYFTIIIAVMMSPPKKSSLLDGSSATDEESEDIEFKRLGIDNAIFEESLLESRQEHNTGKVPNYRINESLEISC